MTLREEAARALGRLGGPGGVRELLQVATDEAATSWLRRTCIEIAAGDKRDPEALRLAREAVKGPPSHPFVEALRLIFQNRRDPVVSESLPALIQQLDPRKVRNWCLDSLMMETGGPAAVRYYLEQYETGRSTSGDGCRPGRDRILELLGRWHAPEAVGLAREVLLNSFAPPRLTRSAIHAAAYLRSPELASLVVSEARSARLARVRRHAIWALPHAAPGRATAVIEYLLSDRPTLTVPGHPVLRIRYQALSSACNLRRPELVPVLRRRFEKETELPLKIPAAAALAACGGEEGKPFLVNVLRERAGQLPEGAIGLRYLAWWACEAAGDEVRPLLREMLDSEHKPIRQLAAYHLVRMGEGRKEMIPLLWNLPWGLALWDEHYDFLAEQFDELEGRDRALACRRLRPYCPNSKSYREELATRRALDKESTGEILTGEPWE